MNDIRPMQLSDVRDVVGIHLKSFRGFFLSSMGSPFLREFYNSVLRDGTHIAYVYHNGAAVLGFVAGTSQPAGFYMRTLRKNWPGFVAASAVPMIKAPLMALKLLRRLAMAGGTAFEDGQALLMSIAVEPNEQSQGIGSRLIAAFLSEAKSRGCSSVVLTTDAVNNDPVTSFYIRSGFHLSHTFTTLEGRRMNAYVYRFGNSSR